MQLAVHLELVRSCVYFVIAARLKTMFLTGVSKSNSKWHIFQSKYTLQEWEFIKSWVRQKSLITSNQEVNQTNYTSFSLIISY